MPVAEKERPAVLKLLRTGKQFDSIAGPQAISASLVLHGRGIGHIGKDIKVGIVPAQFECRLHSPGIAADDHRIWTDHFRRYTGESRSRAVERDRTDRAGDIHAPG